MTAHGDGRRVFGIAAGVGVLFVTGISFASVISLGILLAAYLWALVALVQSTAESADGDGATRRHEPAKT